MNTESDRAENEFSHGGPQSDRKAKRWCANLIDRLFAADDVFSDLNGKKIYSSSRRRLNYNTTLDDDESRMADDSNYQSSDTCMKYLLVIHCST